jgi:hypothetical protein
MPTKALPAFLALLLLLPMQLSHAQTYARILPEFKAALFDAPSPAPTTWYVRPDGGPRDSPRRRATGLPSICDGKADAAPVGTAQGQHCAFNDYRYLWDDQTYNNDAWVIAGGDTVILRGGPWRVGWDAASCPVDSNGNVITQGCGAGYTWAFGGAAVQNPVIPAGSASQHTRILGENFASCSATNKTQIFGGFGIDTPLDLSGAQFVDVQCLEITRHSSCIWFGSPAVPSGCPGQNPVADFDSDGIHTNVQTHDILLQDLWIHGHTGRGIKGPIGAGPVTCERCDIAYNGAAGWDFDDGNATPNAPGATWNFFDSTIEYSGCNQDYPDQSHAISCYSQSTGGYGDGVGTPSGTCLNANVNQSIFRFNTQDALDLGHIDTGTCALSIANSVAYGNNGGTFKWGPNESPAVLTNNTIVANCLRMSAPMDGQPSSYNTHLGDFCRAQDAVPLNFRQGGTATLTNNTIITYAPTTFDVACWDPSCSASTLTASNNIVLGYDNPATYSLGGKVGGPGLFFFQEPIGTVTRTNNLYFGIRGCSTGIATEQCADPKFVNEPLFVAESSLDGFNTTLQSGSPAAGIGAPSQIVGTPASGVAAPPVGSSPSPPPVTPPPPPVSSTSPTGLADNMVEVCPEGGTITAASVSTFIAQFGTGTTWEPPFTFTASLLPFYVYYATPPLNAFDPAPNVVKQLNAQQQTSTYTVTCSNSPGPVTVPALPPTASSPPVVMTPPPVVTNTSPTGLADNMVEVCPEGGTIAAASVSTFVAQFGSGTTWAPPFTFTASLLPFYVFYTTPPLNAFDPAPNVVKQLNAQQQTGAYTVTCSNSPGPVTVPALPPTASSPAVVVTPPPVVTNTSPTGLADNMVEVCPEGNTIAAASVSTFIAQFGTGTTWEPPFTFTTSLLPFYVYYATPPLNAFDPAPNVVKQLNAQQQTSTYTVMCSNSLTPVMVPALPPR